MGTPERGFFCKAAWCSEGSVCCENDSYGLCGSPGTTCCESPGGVLNLCAPDTHCNIENGHCYVGDNPHTAPSVREGVLLQGSMVLGRQRLLRERFRRFVRQPWNHLLRESRGSPQPLRAWELLQP